MMVRLIFDDRRSRISKVFLGEYYYYQRKANSQHAEKNLGRTILNFKIVEDEHVQLIYARGRLDYFCRRNFWRISGQNSLMMLLRLAASSCAAQFTAVLRKPRSSGG